MSYRNPFIDFYMTGVSVKKDLRCIKCPLPTGKFRIWYDVAIFCFGCYYFTKTFLLYWKISKIKFSKKDITLYFMFTFKGKIFLPTNFRDTFRTQSKHMFWLSSEYVFGVTLLWSSRFRVDCCIPGRTNTFGSALFTTQ